MPQELHFCLSAYLKDASQFSVSFNNLIILIRIFHRDSPPGLDIAFFIFALIIKSYNAHSLFPINAFEFKIYSIILILILFWEKKRNGGNLEMNHLIIKK